MTPIVSSEINLLQFSLYYTNVICILSARHVRQGETLDASGVLVTLVYHVKMTFSVCMLRLVKGSDSRCHIMFYEIHFPGKYPEDLSGSL